MNKKTILIFLFFLLIGCKQNNISSVMVLDLNDYTKFEIISLEGEGECAGTVADPCMAIAKFMVKEEITINPMQLLEVNTPVKEIKGYNKKITFKPGHDYTLKYEVLKINPTDTIEWSFAGKK